MPSNNRPIYFYGHENRNRLGRLPLALIYILLFAITALPYVAYGFKIYILASNSTAFEACRVLYVREYSSITLIGFSAVAGCSLLTGFVSSLGCIEDEEDEKPEPIYEQLPLVVVAGALAYTFIAFGVSVVAWSLTTDIKESVLFYAEFYGDDFSKCAKGQDLAAVETGVVLYKIESFLSMMLILLFCPCGICCLALFTDAF